MNTFLKNHKSGLRWIVMFQIETPGILNGHLVFPEHVIIDMRLI